MPAPAAAPPRPSPAGRCAHGRRASPAGAPATAQPGRLPPAALLPGALPSAPGAPPWPGAPPGAPPRPSPVGVPRCVSLSDAQHRPSPAYLGAPPRHSSVYSMFNGMIDSRQVRRRSSSQSSGGSSSRQHRTTSEMEFDSLRQEIQKRDAFLKAQEEYQKEQQAHAQRLHAQQMAAIQAMYQAQGMTFVIPEVAPAPVLPQWGMFAHMSFSPAPQGSGVQGSNPYQTPPPASGQHEDQQSGQHIDPALGDFVNNLFASGGSGHNSNEPGAMAALALERLIFGG
ncbi:hypothetical protein U9M48_042038 [Paspalum notatum var. saurae]|uniref:Uncharacterized protein n=2 Tax=Paspalum notatum var. saurae TaxID=547442 RepID=A0AAQ3UTX7_PASNO